MPPQSRARAVLGKVKRRLRPAVAPPAKKAAKKAAKQAWKPKAKPKAAPRRSKYPALPGDRLLERPVFVLSSIRSGSTLLRVMLNSHSQLHAPHELHLAGLHVQFGGRFVADAMTEIDLDEVQAEYLLWDRVLHRELTRNGKQIIVNKTPSDAFRWRRILDCWPDARFIFLLRHPAAIADSWSRAKPDLPKSRTADAVLKYMRAVEEARSQHDGLTVRYEDITTDPEREMRRLCDFLGVEFEPAMVDYGQVDHGSFKAGLGDWSDRIRSGKVQPIERLPEPDEIPPQLVEMSKKWGYLPS